VHFAGEQSKDFDLDKPAEVFPKLQTYENNN
jgi:hypothetical protein